MKRTYSDKMMTDYKDKKKKNTKKVAKKPEKGD